MCIWLGCYWLECLSANGYSHFIIPLKPLIDSSEQDHLTDKSGLCFIDKDNK